MTRKPHPWAKPVKLNDGTTFDNICALARHYDRPRNVVKYHLRTYGDMTRLRPIKEARQ